MLKPNVGKYIRNYYGWSLERNHWDVTSLSHTFLVFTVYFSKTGAG